MCAQASQAKVAGLETSWRDEAGQLHETLQKRDAQLSELGAQHSATLKEVSERSKPIYVMSMHSRIHCCLPRLI